MLRLFSKIMQNHDLDICSAPLSQIFWSGMSIWPRSTSHILSFYACKNEQKKILHKTKNKLNPNRKSVLTVRKCIQLSADRASIKYRQNMQRSWEI